MNIKFSPFPPPVYEKCMNAFGGKNVDFEKGMVFAYGDTIHSKFLVPIDLIHHEMVHLNQQQSIGPDKWWDQYINEQVFRFDQELQAYRAQLKFLKSRIRDRNKFYKEKVRLASDLASPIYGNMCTVTYALRMIDTVE